MANPTEFFETTTPPKYLESVQQRVAAFVDRHASENRRVVLVTSGGTTVPLEAQTVRFIDNFSAGTRGATSAEQFIEAGYAVIFLHRQFSLQPYSRHYTHSKNCFLDYMIVSEDGSIRVAPEYATTMRPLLDKYAKVKAAGLMEMIDYVTVTDYLFQLRMITITLSRLGPNALFYLAAAVSDFFIPQSKLIEHKIQSGDGALKLELDQVPKFITPLVKEWAPRAFVVSFKLETDPSILVSKARTALSRYGHQMVVGNILSTRKQVVNLITADTNEEIRLSDDDLKNNVEIESILIPELLRRHESWIEACRVSN